MNLASKNLGLTLTVILGGAALAYTYLLFVPARQSLAGVNQEIQSRQLYILETARAEAELERVESRLREARQYAQQQREALPPSSELSQYTSELTTCASDSGVRIVRFSPQFPQDMPPLSRVSVFVAIEGEVPQVFEFASRLEALPVAIWCQQFTVDNQLKQAGTLRAEFELLIFADNLEKSG